MFCGTCLGGGLLTVTTSVNKTGVVGWCRICEEHVMSMTDKETLEHIVEMREGYERLEKEFHDTTNWTM